MNRYNYKLPVMILREGDYFVIHTPALDLSVQGRTKLEVQRRFVEAVQLFLEELERKGSMDEVLEELGWEKHARQPWQPPQLVGAPTEIEVAIPA